MHPKARKWDQKWLKSNPPAFMPTGRPCDWCGEPVREGYIHIRCWLQELPTIRTTKLEEKKCLRY